MPVSAYEFATPGLDQVTRRAAAPLTRHRPRRDDELPRVIATSTSSEAGRRDMDGHAPGVLGGDCKPTWPPGSARSTRRRAEEPSPCAPGMLYPRGPAARNLARAEPLLRESLAGSSAPTSGSRSTSPTRGTSTRSCAGRWLRGSRRTCMEASHSGVARAPPPRRGGTGVPGRSRCSRISRASSRRSLASLSPPSGPRCRTGFGTPSADRDGARTPPFSIAGVDEVHVRGSSALSPARSPGGPQSSRLRG